MPLLNCATGTLSTYNPTTDRPWNRTRALHLYRRIGMSAPISTIQEAINSTPFNVVQQLIEEAAELRLPGEPEWAFWTLADYSRDTDVRNRQVTDQVLGWVRQWLCDIKNNGLRDKLSFFWHNHFVTRFDDYGCPS